MIFVRTLNGSDVPVAAVNEAIDAEERWLVKLRLRDGTTRLALSENWKSAKSLCSRQMVAASSGAFLLTLENVDGKFLPRKHPIVAWVIQDWQTILPMTGGWVHEVDDCAVLYADGSVSDGDEHFDSLEEWVQCEEWLRRN